MNPRWLALLLALVLSLSGCLGFFGEEDPEPEAEGENDDPTGEDPADDPEDETGDDPEEDTGENTTVPPEAVLEANVTTGQAPLNVSFSLDGSVDESLEMAWTLDLGDGSDPVEGDDLPGTYDHTFEDVGNFTVEFTVFDGESQETQTVVIEVVEPDVNKVIEGSFLIGNPLQGCVLALYTLGEDNGVTYFQEGLDESLHGLPYSVEFTSTAPALGYLVAFSEGMSVSTDQANGPDPEAATTLTGTVPDGAETIVVSACGGVMVDVTITIG